MENVSVKKNLLKLTMPIFIDIALVMLLGAVDTVKREFSSLEENEALVICGSLYLAALFTDKDKNKNIFIKGSAYNV